MLKRSAVKNTGGSKLRNDYYDIDLEDFPDDLNTLFLLFNLTQAGIIGELRQSCSGTNFHATREKEYSFGLHDENYDTLSEWKGVSTVTTVIYEYIWVGKRVRRKVAEAGDWFVLDGIELANRLQERN